MTALGLHQLGIRVLAFDLPQATGVDGLLGLDFLRDNVLTIDFRAGVISLACAYHRAGVAAHPLRSARPGVAPVGSPFSRTSVPLTSTCSTPSASVRPAA
jgi:hypothetical protein